MSHRLSKEKLKLLRENKQKDSAAEGTQSLSRSELKKKNRNEYKKSWFEKMRERGGLRPKKAKHWGDECSISKCPKWKDGYCQYPERDVAQCLMELKDVKKNAD